MENASLEHSIIRNHLKLIAKNYVPNVSVFITNLAAHKLGVASKTKKGNYRIYLDKRIPKEYLLENLLHEVKHILDGEVDVATKENSIPIKDLLVNKAYWKREKIIDAWVAREIKRKYAYLLIP